MEAFSYILAIILVLAQSVVSQQTCGANVTVLDGQTVQVTSPDYPEQYPPNQNCLWRVHAPDLSQLTVSCPVVDLQWTIFGCVDTVGFSDAENFNQLPSYCGNKRPPAEIGFGDTVFIQFISDNSGTDNGFVCNITAKKSVVDNDCECGLANKVMEDRVYQGAAVSKHQYPWLAILTNLESVPKALCGATIINSHYVLTSARCVIGVHPGDLRIRVGEHDLSNNNESPPHKIHEIEEILIHPEFSSTNLHNDLALVRVSEQILFADNVRPACLPKGVLDLAGANLTAAGWGASSPTIEQSTLPRQARLPVQPPTLEECSKLLPEVLALTEGQLCTTSDAGSSVCTGDFGGPLFLEVDGVYTLAAISSFNTACGYEPTVNSRVDYHLGWIIGASSDAILCGSQDQPSTTAAPSTP